MEFVMKELRDGLKYHTKQLEENQNKIQLNEQSNEDLVNRNEKHIQAIKEISQVIELLEKEV
jgi:hypothetical protein